MWTTWKYVNCRIYNCWHLYLKELPFCADETNDFWLTCVSQLNEYTARVGDFALHIADFASLDCEDQSLLIHSATHSVILLCLCIQSSRQRLLTNDLNWNYFNIPANSSFSQHLQQIFPFFFDISQLTHSIGKELQLLELDDKEVALFIIILIASIG